MTKLNCYMPLEAICTYSNCDLRLHSSSAIGNCAGGCQSLHWPTEPSACNNWAGFRRLSPAKNRPSSCIDALTQLIT